jgi:hypothetical protein
MKDIVPEKIYAVSNVGKKYHGITLTALQTEFGSKIVSVALLTLNLENRSE